MGSFVFAAFFANGAVAAIVENRIFLDKGPMIRPATLLSRRGTAMPIVAMVLVVVLLGVFLWLLDRSEREEEEHGLIRDALWVEQSLRFQLASDVDRLEQLADMIGRSGGTDVTAAMRHLVTTNPAVERVLWLDAEGRIAAAVPPVPDGRAVEEGAEPSPRGDALRLARSLGKRIYTAPYPLPQAGMGFDVVVPVYQGRGDAGALVGVFSIDDILTHHVPWWIAERYQIAVADSNGAVLGAKSRIDEPTPRRSHAIPFDPPGRGMTLVATVHRTESNLGRTVLVAAIFGLTGSALWSLWMVRRHIRRRVRAEQQLRTEHAFRKAMEDSLTVGMRARDLEGRIIYVNPAFCRMVGWSEAELLDRGPPMPYWPPEDLERCAQVFSTVLAGEAPPDGFELRLMRRNGERFDALIYEAPLIDANGRQTGWMGSFVDITERKRAEDLARQQQERLQHTARVITMGEMASTLAHELNQPLSAIASYSAGCLNKLRADTVVPAELIPPLDKLSKQAMRAGRIIRQIHEFVRKRDPRVAPCDMAEVVEDSVSLIRADARKHGVRIEVDLAPATPPVMADRILVQQVLLNLMRNGMEAMAQTPRDARLLRVTARVQNGAVLTRIRDRGCGVAPEVAETLFSPFFTTKKEGMGMGLNICRSIIESHHGRLWFEPARGGGTAFLFSLPVAS